MNTTPDTMEDILTYLYCATDNLEIIRNAFDEERSRILCADALYGQINNLRQLCDQLSMQIQNIPHQTQQQIAKAVADKHILK